MCGWAWPTVELYLCALNCHLCRVDKDRSGAISADELQQALSNGELNTVFVCVFCHLFLLTLRIMDPLQSGDSATDDRSA